MNLSNEFEDVEKELIARKNNKRKLKRQGKFKEDPLKIPCMSKRAQLMQNNKEIFDTLSDISTDDSDIQIMHVGKTKKISDSVIIIESDNDSENISNKIVASIDYLTCPPEYQVIQKVNYLKYDVKNSPISDHSKSSSSSDIEFQDVIHIDGESPAIIINSENNEDHYSKLELPNETQKCNKRKRKRKSEKRFPDNPELQNDSKMFKYWSQRYELFERFDMGIKLDKESWYSVTAEYIAKEQAGYCDNNDYVLDGFCGAGGNTIQFSYKCLHVLALDIDPIKIELTKNNCNVYGIDMNKVTIMKDNFYSFANLYNNTNNSLVKMPAIDVVFLSPPWGGQDYLNEKAKNQIKFSIDIEKLISSARLFKPKRIMIFLPRNTDESHLRSFLQPNETIEITKHTTRYKGLISKKIKAITAIFKCNV